MTNDRGPVYILSAAAIGPSIDTTRGQRRLLTDDPAPADLSALVKELTGEESRRIGHFAQLAVACSRLALNRFKKTITDETPLYLATGLGEAQSTVSLFQQVMESEDSLVSPYSFVNAVSSTTAFHIAKTAGLKAKNITISQEELSFEWALYLAAADITDREAKYALVGGVDESCRPREGHMRRISLRDNQIMGEGSGCLLLGPSHDDAVGELLDITWFDLGNEDTGAWSEKIAHLVERHRKRTDRVVLLPGFRLEQEHLRTLHNRITGIEVNNYLHFCGCFHTAASFGIASVFDAPHESATLYLHVNSNASGRTMAVVFRAFTG